MLEKVKQGMKVRELRSGERREGKIDAVRETEKGLWIDVNFAEPRKPKAIKSFRKAQLEAA